MRRGRPRRPRARPLRRGHAPAERACPARCSPARRWSALQEDVPVVPAAIYGTQLWKPGNFHPVSIAWGEPMRFDGLPKGAQGLPGGVGRDRAAHPRALRLARRGARARPAARGDATDEQEREARRRPREIVGTVAIVGFPNVGKSTLINRLTETRAGGRARDAGRHARPQGARSASGTASYFLLIDTGGVDDLATDAVQPRDRRAGARRDRRRPTSSSSSSTRAPGSRRATRSSPRSCARRTSR